MPITHMTHTPDSHWFWFIWCVFLALFLLVITLPFIQKKKILYRLQSIDTFFFFFFLNRWLESMSVLVILFVCYLWCVGISLKWVVVCVCVCVCGGGGGGTKVLLAVHFILVSSNVCPILLIHLGSRVKIHRSKEQ